MDLLKTLEIVLPRFLRRCDAKSTRIAYKRELLRFLQWLPDAPSDEVLFDYRDYLRGKNLGATTVRWRLTVVRSFLLFARRRGFIEQDLVSDFKAPKGKTGFAPRVLSGGEREELIQTPDRRGAPGRRDATVLVCLAVAGLRAGEICSLNSEDVKTRSYEVVLTVNGKGKKQRQVILPGKWVKLFQSYLRMWPRSRRFGNPFFWCGKTILRRITPAAVSYLVKGAAVAADLSGLHPHALRHTAATLALNGGQPIHKVQNMMGHSSVLVTSRYLHVG